MRAEPRSWRDLPLVCPVCRAPLPIAADAAALHCPSCGARYPLVSAAPSAGRGAGGGRDGAIPALLPPDLADATIDANNQVYDRIADEYDETLPAHVVWHYLRKRLRFLARVAMGGAGPGARRVLDVGCGTGTLANRLAAGGALVVGVDVSLGMLARLQARGRAIPVGASGTALPFPGGWFDLVISVAAFHHISDRDKVAATLGEMWRVVRPGGTVVVWDHNPDNPYWPLLLRRMPQDAAVERLVPAAELIEGLVAAGAEAGAIRRYRLGFVPDFAPAPAMPLVRKLERAAERLPLVSRLAAHNVVVARKA